MLELDSVRIASDEVVSVHRREGCLRVRILIPWQVLPHFVLLPDRFMMRWEHLDDAGLPVRLMAWTCRPCEATPNAVVLDLRLCFTALEKDGQSWSASSASAGSGSSRAGV
jgi:hypothetical protein